MNAVEGYSLLGAIALATVFLWARFILPSGRSRYAAWVVALTRGQVSLYSIAMLALGYAGYLMA